MGTVLTGVVVAMLTGAGDAPERQVFISVKGNDAGFRLHRRVYTPKPDSESVCLAPCDQPITVTEHSHFFLTDSEQMTTADFQLIAGEQVLLDAKAGSRSEHSTGSILIGTGIASICVGVTAFVVGFFSSLASDQSETTPFTLIGVGISSMVVGVAAMIVGAVLRASSAAHVTQTPDFSSAPESTPAL